MGLTGCAMAKTLKEAAITTPNARAKLAAGKIHWRGVDPEVHLGYRKAKRGGAWVVRWRNGPGYRQEGIGTADDEISEGTLDFNAAVRKARATVEAARAEAKATADGPLLRVKTVVEAYASERDTRETRRKGRAVHSDATHRLKKHLLGREAIGQQEAIPAAPLADVALHALAESDLIGWRDSLPENMKVTTRRRLMNDLRAALNGAYAKHRARLDATFPAIVKHGLKAIPHDEDEAVPVARDNQILTDAQVGGLLAAARTVDAEQGWEGDLFRLVVVLAATGARFSQVIRMRVGDAQREHGRLMVPVSRKGKGKKVASIPVPVGRDVLDVLQPIVTGRKPDAFLLEKWWHKEQGGAFKWHKDKRGPWLYLAQLRSEWPAIRERAGMPGLIPYALRHSSIVRGIRANLPIRLVAASHDTSAEMIERHYAKWIVSGLEELVARAVVPLVPEDEVNVIPLSLSAKR